MHEYVKKTCALFTSGWNREETETQQYRECSVLSNDSFLINPFGRCYFVSCEHFLGEWACRLQIDQHEVCPLQAAKGDQTPQLFPVWKRRIR